MIVRYLALCVSLLGAINLHSKINSESIAQLNSIIDNRDAEAAEKMCQLIKVSAEQKQLLINAAQRHVDSYFERSRSLWLNAFRADFWKGVIGAGIATASTLYLLTTFKSIAEETPLSTLALGIPHRAYTALAGEAPGGRAYWDNVTLYRIAKRTNSLRIGLAGLTAFGIWLACDGFNQGNVYSNLARARRVLEAMHTLPTE